MADVLIIEPSADLAQVIALGFARKEITSVIANSAEDAIKQADQSKPKLVILELLMPKHNGLEFIHEFRSYGDWIDIPIIIYSQISADEAGITEQVKKDIGIKEHFYKPTTSLQKLVDQAEQVL